MKMMNDVPSGTKKKIQFLLRKKKVKMKMMRDMPSGTKNKIVFLLGKKSQDKNDEERAIRYKKVYCVFCRKKN